jgi:hypothetical protein
MSSEPVIAPLTVAHMCSHSWFHSPTNAVNTVILNDLKVVAYMIFHATECCLITVFNYRSNSSSYVYTNFFILESKFAAN